VGDQLHALAALPPGMSPDTHITAGWVVSVAYSALLYFSSLSHKRHDFRKENS